MLARCMLQKLWSARYSKPYRHPSRAACQHSQSPVGPVTGCPAWPPSCLFCRRDLSSGSRPGAGHGWTAWPDPSGPAAFATRKERTHRGASIRAKQREATRSVFPALRCSGWFFSPFTFSVLNFYCVSPHDFSA